MYNTNNPIPSSALEDMADNAQTFDALVTKTEGTTTDRLGRTRRVFQQILMDMGFQPLSGSFQTGATITARNQTLYDEVSHVFYSWNGALPKVVPAGSTPATSGGIGALLWVDRTDLMLRNAISSVDGFALIGQCESVSDVRALVPTTAGQRFLLKSYVSGYGLGGGVLYYDSEDTTTVDNGITTFVTTSGARIKRDKSEYVTFTKAGVLPGDIDNAAAIARINAYTGASIRVDLDFNCPLAIVNSSIKSIDVDSGYARRITWTNATSNGFHLTHSSDISENNPITIDKIQNISTFAPLFNDCITVTSNSPVGSTGVSVESNRVTFKGNSSVTGWRHGWVLTDCRNVRINGMSFLGDRSNITSGAAVRITGTNSPVETMLHQCQAFFCAGLIEADGNTEGLYVSQCTAIIVARGVMWYNTAGVALRPYITIQQSHIYAAEAAIVVQDVQHFNIGGGNAFYSLSVGTTDQCFIRISTTIPNTRLDGVISGNIMYNAFYNPLCKGVEIFSSDATIKSSINITGNKISGANDVLYLHDFVNGVRFGRDNSCNNYANKYTVSANATFDNDLPDTTKTSTNIRKVDNFTIQSKGQATVTTNANGDASLILPAHVGSLVSATLTMCDSLGTLSVNTSASTGSAIAFRSSLVNQSITVYYNVIGSIT